MFWVVPTVFPPEVRGSGRCASSSSPVDLVTVAAKIADVCVLPMQLPDLNVLSGIAPSPVLLLRVVALHDSMSSTRRFRMLNSSLSLRLYAKALKLV